MGIMDDAYSSPRSARNGIRARGLIDRHNRAADAVAENEGRSAPPSAANRPMGLSADWRETFAAPPTPQPFFSRPPTISAREAAMKASPEPFMPSTGPISIAAPLTSPTGNAASDAANLQQSMAMAANPRQFISARPNATRQAAVASVPDVQLDPSLPKAAISATGITRGPAFNVDAAQIALKDSHPNVFIAGSPENTAFVEHAKQFGKESAFKNLDKILGTNQIAAR